MPNHQLPPKMLLKGRVFLQPVDGGGAGLGHSEVVYSVLVQPDSGLLCSIASLGEGPTCQFWERILPMDGAEKNAFDVSFFMQEVAGTEYIYTPEY